MHERNKNSPGWPRWGEADVALFPLKMTFKWRVSLKLGQDSVHTLQRFLLQSQGSTVFPPNDHLLIFVSLLGVEKFHW